MQRSRQLVEKGGAALASMQKIDEDLAAIRSTMDTDFPLDNASVHALRERIAEQLPITGSANIRPPALRAFWPIRSSTASST